jgi:hypothetical protein
VYIYVYIFNNFNPSRTYARAPLGSIDVQAEAVFEKPQGGGKNILHILTICIHIQFIFSYYLIHEKLF